MTAPDETHGHEPKPPDYEGLYAAGREILIAAHGLLAALGAYVLLSSYSESGSLYPLFLLPLLLLSHAALYSLPAGYVVRSGVQQVLILVAVTATAAWLLQFAVEAGLGYFSAVACLLLVPLLWRRPAVWFGATLGVFAFAWIAGALGWTYPETAPARATEGAVLVAGVLVWIAYAFLFDHR